MTSPSLLNWFTTTQSSNLTYLSTTKASISGIMQITISYTNTALLLLTLCIILLRYMRKMCKPNNQSFDIVFEIGNETLVTRVNYQKLCHSFGNYSFTTGKYVHDITLKGPCHRPRLCIDWPTLVIRNRLNNTCYPLRTSVQVSIRHARLIRKILATTYWCLPMAKNSDGIAYIPLTSQLDTYQSTQTLSSVCTGHASAPEVNPPGLYPTLSEIQMTEFPAIERKE